VRKIALYLICINLLSLWSVSRRGCTQDDCTDGIAMRGRIPEQKFTDTVPFDLVLDDQVLAITLSYITSIHIPISISILDLPRPLCVLSPRPVKSLSGDDSPLIIPRRPAANYSKPARLGTNFPSTRPKETPNPQFACIFLYPETPKSLHS
jgi:hypothetical protein